MIEKAECTRLVHEHFEIIFNDVSAKHSHFEIGSRV